MKLFAKRGQVTIFVIVALVIVGILLAIFLYPRSSLTAQVNENPSGYLRECIEPVINTELGTILAQGGFSNPEGYILIDGVKIKYLCYTSDYYATCINQVPLITRQVENELTRIVQQNMPLCLQQMKTDYEQRGISVSVGNTKTNTTINSKGILIDVQAPITITKDSTQTFNGFEVIIPSKVYDLLITATSIIEFETFYGDADTVLYLQYYPNLKIEKNLLSDGTTIYKITDVTTEEQFTFASRSVAWPAGYGAS
jgi:hypothetical protein